MSTNNGAGESAAAARRLAWAAGGLVLVATGIGSAAFALLGLVFAGGGIAYFVLAVPLLAAGYGVLRRVPRARLFGFVVAVAYAVAVAYVATTRWRGLTPTSGQSSIAIDQASALVALAFVAAAMLIVVGKTDRPLGGRTFAGPRVGAPGAWSWRESADPFVNFCVWALIEDGFRVPPFDSHPGGTAALHGAGLDAEAWRTWLHAVVGAQETLSRRIRESADLTKLTDAQRGDLGAAFEAAQPPAVWAGSAAVRAELDRLWAAYKPIGEVWKHQAEQDLRASRLSGRRHRDLWRRLDAAHGQLASLSVYFVHYPWPALEIVSPAACVVALGPDPDADDIYAQTLERAVRTLGGTAAQPPVRRGWPADTRP